MIIIESMEKIEADLYEASRYADYVTRVFLENGDPFVLSADKGWRGCNNLNGIENKQAASELLEIAEGGLGKR